jgi:HAD superfamily hydrolase (TIGR01509 family)
MLRYFAFLIPLILTIFVPLKAEETKIKAVVFDYGGVIGTVDKDVVLNYVMKTLGVSKEEALKLLKNYKEAQKNGVQSEAYWTGIAKEHDIDLKGGWEKPFTESVLDNMHEVPGTLAVIDELRQEGVRVGMLSNITERAARYVRMKGYYEGYEPLLLTYQIGVEKPDPKAYEMLIKSVQLKPEEIFFVDDRLENVVAAEKLGINAFHFENAAALKRELISLGLLKEKRITFDKHSIWYESFGRPSDEPLILISGATTVGRYWSDELCMDLVKRGFYVTRFDHRDVGLSSAHPDEYSLQHMAEDVVGIIQALGVNKAHLMGHSMGGYVAQMTAALFPEKVKSITVLSAGPIGHTEETSRPFNEEEQKLIEKAQTLLGAPRPSGPKEAILNHYHNAQCFMAGGIPAEKELLHDYLNDIARSKHSHEQSLKHVKMMIKFIDEMENWSPSLAKIKCPVLVIQGGLDPIIPAHRGGLALHNAIKHSELLFLPKMGHMLFNKELQGTIADRFDQFQKESVSTWSTQQSKSPAANS